MSCVVRLHNVRRKCSKSLIYFTRLLLLFENHLIKVDLLVKCLTCSDIKDKGGVRPSPLWEVSFLSYFMSFIHPLWFPLPWLHITARLPEQLTDQVSAHHKYGDYLRHLKKYDVIFLQTVCVIYISYLSTLAWLFIIQSTWAKWLSWDSYVVYTAG